MANNLYLNRTMEGLIKEASKYFLFTKCLTLCEHLLKAQAPCEV